MSTLLEMVKDTKVYFSWYSAGNLWYRVEWVDKEDAIAFFEFPVPIDDVGSAVFHAEDKAILYMRYIRKHLKLLENYI